MDIQKINNLNINNFYRFDRGGKGTCFYHSLLFSLQNLKTKNNIITTLLQSCCIDGYGLRLYLKTLYNELDEQKKEEICNPIFIIDNNDLVRYNIKNHIYDGFQACEKVVEKSFDINSDVWAGDIEIRIIQYLLNIKIYIYRDNDHTFYYYPVNIETNDVVYLYYQVPFHYQSLIPKNIINSIQNKKEKNKLLKNIKDREKINNIINKSVAGFNTNSVNKLIDLVDIIINNNNSNNLMRNILNSKNLL
jgi:hypothetical protein